MGKSALLFNFSKAYGVDGIEDYLEGGELLRLLDGGEEMKERQDEVSGYQTKSCNLQTSKKYDCLGHLPRPGWDNQYSHNGSRSQSGDCQFFAR